MPTPTDRVREAFAGRLLRQAAAGFGSYLLRPYVQARFRALEQRLLEATGEFQRDLVGRQLLDAAGDLSQSLQDCAEAARVCNQLCATVGPYDPSLSLRALVWEQLAYCAGLRSANFLFCAMLSGDAVARLAEAAARGGVETPMWRNACCVLANCARECPERVAGAGCFFAEAVSAYCAAHKEDIRAGRALPLGQKTAAAAAGLVAAGVDPGMLPDAEFYTKGTMN